MGKNKRHKETEFHCPFERCLYSVGSDRFFKQKKFLDQHIAKVHAEKKYTCTKCSKGFGLDWWRRHHEKTCGVEWRCDCGVKYACRESLLTHARRLQHMLPEDILHSEKRDKNPEIQNKIKKFSPPPKPKEPEKPLIILIQPIIQNITCIQPAKSSENAIRQILPKASQPCNIPITEIIPVKLNFTPVNNAQSPVPPTVLSDHSGDQFFTESKVLIEEVDQSADVKPFRKAVAETQTSINFGSGKSCHSQGSQCSGRASKSLKRISSTHTQTAESTLVKMKKKNPSCKSRRKSVAITTDTIIDQGQSIWSDIKDLIFQQDKTCRNSISTQTVSENIDVCDSQTLTDKNCVGFPWDTSNPVKEIGFEMLSEMDVDDPLETLPGILNNDNNLPDLKNMLSDPSGINNEFCIIDKDDVEKTADFQNAEALENNLPDELLSSVFDECPKSDLEVKVEIPDSTDIHTQTIPSASFDNLLANMETQTTGDFTFSDLEFSDTETQTPWEDFPEIDDTSADQLSIEIQTDFSSLDDLNQDPYEFINNMDMENFIGGYSEQKGTSLGVNIETQTYDQFSFPQFTNSESQTLDISSCFDLC